MKLVIVGKGRGFHEAPYEGNVWGLTQIILNHPVSMVIDMNVYDDMRWGEAEYREAKLSRRIAEANDIPYIDLANYPIEEVKKEFGVDYFSNTLDYAIALAILKGYESIDLYGCNMETGTEYAHQKPSCEFWIGVAIGRGVRVNIFGDHCSLIKTGDGKVYGYDTMQSLMLRKGREDG